MARNVTWGMIFAGLLAVAMAACPAGAQGRSPRGQFNQMVPPPPPPMQQPPFRGGQGFQPFVPFQQRNQATPPARGFGGSGMMSRFGKRMPDIRSRMGMANPWAMRPGMGYGTGPRGRSMGMFGRPPMGGQQQGMHGRQGGQFRGPGRGQGRMGQGFDRHQYSPRSGSPWGAGPQCPFGCQGRGMGAFGGMSQPPFPGRQGPWGQQGPQSMIPRGPEPRRGGHDAHRGPQPQQAPRHEQNVPQARGPWGRQDQGRFGPPSHQGGPQGPGNAPQWAPPMGQPGWMNQPGGFGPWGRQQTPGDNARPGPRTGTPQQPRGPQAAPPPPAPQSPQAGPPPGKGMERRGRGPHNEEDRDKAQPE